MQLQNVAILKALVAVAWSDGDFGPSEKEMLDALLVAFDATDEEANEIRQYAAEKRTLSDVPLEDLTSDDLRVLVQHAVLLTFIDGTQNANEKAFVEQLARYVGIPDAEATHLMAVGEARAKHHLSRL